MCPTCSRCGALELNPDATSCGVCGEIFYDVFEEELPDYSRSVSSSATGCYLHENLIELIDTYTSIAEQDEDFKDRYQSIIDGLETTYQAAREQDENFAKLEKTQESYQEYKEALEDYKSLVDERVDEPVLQDFLEKNPSILDPLVKIMYKKFTLAGELIPDFLLILQNNTHLFVEIENPSKKIFNKDGTLTAEYRTGYKQISDYTHWARDNISFLKDPNRPRKCPDINTKNIRGLLVIGHSADFTEEHKKQLEKLNHDVRGSYEIKTFDQLYSERIFNLETFGFKWEE